MSEIDLLLDKPWENDKFEFKEEALLSDELI
jgi:hypothetical protein